MPAGAARVLALGVTYKPDVADLRESASIGTIRCLRERGAAVSYADPYVPALRVDDVEVERVDPGAVARSTRRCC